MSDISSINNGKWDTEASTQDYEQPIEKTYEHIFFETKNRLPPSIQGIREIFYRQPYKLNRYVSVQ